MTWDIQKIKSLYFIGENFVNLMNTKWFIADESKFDHKSHFFSILCVSITHSISIYHVENHILHIFFYSRVLISPNPDQHLKSYRIFSTIGFVTHHLVFFPSHTNCFKSVFLPGIANKKQPLGASASVFRQSNLGLVCMDLLFSGINI